MNNPSNFIVAYDVTKQIPATPRLTWITADDSDWSDTFEANYDTSNAEYVDEDRQDFADNVLRANDCLSSTDTTWIQA